MSGKQCSDVKRGVGQDVKRAMSIYELRTGGSKEEVIRQRL